MWQEARRLEKKLRGMMVDHRKRAERRREYYEKIKLDPNQFLQVHGRPCKISLDPAVAAAAEAPATMMPWQGNKDNMIDRFDGRAHLDIISDPPRDAEEVLDRDQVREQRAMNYERYRILIQNEFLKIPEEKFLRMIELEEKFGGKTYQATKAKEDKKKLEKGKAAIGFVYEDSTPKPDEPLLPVDDNDEDDDGGSDSDTDSEMDLDLTVDIMALSTEAQSEINEVGRTFDLGESDFIRYLAKDIEEAADLRNAKLQEEEKAAMSGRKSRRERRILRELKLKDRKISPPSYAARESPSYGDYRSGSSSRSTTPETSGKVEFITSFGIESDDDANKLDVNAGANAASTSGLKRLRQLQRDEELSGKRATATTVIGPFLPADDEKKSRRRSRSRSRDKRRHRSRSRSRDRRRRSRSPVDRNRRRDRQSRRSRSSSRERSRRREAERNRRRSSSRNNRSRRKSRSKSPVRRRHSPTPTEKRRTEAKSKRSKASSSSSSSSDEDTAPTKYRSKYRHKRRTSSTSSSSSSSEASKSKKKDKGSNSPEEAFKERPLFEAVEIVRDDAPVTHLPTAPPPPLPVRRYYGRRAQNDSDSELSFSDSEENKNGSHDSRDSKVASKVPIPQQANKVGDVSAAVKEKIRKKLQAQIRKQFKADKRAEEEKRQREEEDRIQREEEMRELALRMRRREKTASRWPGSGGSSSDGGRSSRSRSASPEAISGRSGNGDRAQTSADSASKRPIRSPRAERETPRRRSPPSTTSGETTSSKRSRRSRSRSRDNRSRHLRSKTRSKSPPKKLKLVDY